MITNLESAHMLFSSNNYEITQLLHNYYSIIAQLLHNNCTIFIQKLHNYYTIIAHLNKHHQDEIRTPVY